MACAFANYYANAGGRKDDGEHTFNQYLSHIVSSEGGEETSTPTWYDADAATMTTVPTMQKGATAFLVTGDASRNKVQTMPGGGFSTVVIELPADWDVLMAAKGYPVLTDMYLTQSSGNNGESTTFSASESRKSVRTPIRTDYYRPTGQYTARPNRGLYIRRNIYSDGSADAQKRMYR